MYYVKIDERSNGFGGIAGSCSKCCCEPIGMRPGEVVKMTLDYAAWTLPLGGRGLVPTTEFTIITDRDSCSAAPIDGFANPNVDNQIFNVPRNVAQGTPIDFDLLSVTLPAGNQFEYELVPVSGPTHGTLTTPINGNPWTYTGAQGFNGYDQFWVRITDAQGRSIIRPIYLRVGTPGGNPPFGWGLFPQTNGLQIDRAQVNINENMQSITFPMMLLPMYSCDTIDGCVKFRVTVKAYANDCDVNYSHITCFDVFCRKC